MPIARNPRLKPLKELAIAVGAKIKIDYIGIGDGQYVLYDSRREILAREYDAFDMLDAIEAYYGSHENYITARAQYNYMTGNEA
jgi:hypothetical protein